MTASLFTESTATISEDGRYRYDLGRRWDEGPRVLWIMLNPSIADADIDDPTIRRCLGFTRAWGYGGLVVVNLFAMRATDPRELYTADDPVGPENDEYLRRHAAGAGLVVAAWGSHGWLHGRDADVRKILDELNVTARCLGHTNAGAPRHPLYLRKDSTREVL